MAKLPPAGVTITPDMFIHVGPFEVPTGSRLLRRSVVTLGVEEHSSSLQE